MNDNRPVNLDIPTIRLPITAHVSILHRISGLVLLVGVLVLMYMLDMSLRSQDSFDSLIEMLSTPFAKIIVWGVLAAFTYHFVMGLRHLIMDLGIGETLEGGKLSAKLSLVIAIALIILMGVWIW